MQHLAEAVQLSQKVAGQNPPRTRRVNKLVESTLQLRRMNDDIEARQKLRGE